MPNDHLGIFGSSSEGHPDHLTELREALARDGVAADTENDSDTDSDGNTNGLFASEEPIATRADRKRRRRRRVRKFFATIVVIVVMALIAAGLGYFAIKWWGSNDGPQDYAGVGSTAIVVRVHSGDGLSNVAQTLLEADVVADAALFVTTAQDSGELTGLQPGFYWVHQQSSAADIVAELVDPDHRVGQLRVIPGQTLADITIVSPTGDLSVKPGILTAVTAACVPTNDEQQCFSRAELDEVARSATPRELGLVSWAADAVGQAADADRRLEGLILPGDYDIEPGSSALHALTTVLSASASTWNTTGIVAAAEKQGRTPYEIATIASLVEAEGIGPDMRKVARVIDNRLAISRKLQFDSTVNYGLNRAQISTTNDERLDPNNIYSTYAHAGLTPTPINSPGPQAIDAAVDPAQGDWMYFVAIDLDGNSCFSVTDAEHMACVEQARANGVFG